ncbi:MAG TPA: ATP-binding protein [Candidatus Nitrosotalea sp.]|nr:ATP-binding protein [Candidatus Nitrosotalea sp.]
MERIKTALLLSFRTKVIVPVVTVMILLLATSMWLVNREITRQIQEDAAQLLLTADAMLKKWQETRADDLSLRFYNVVKESRIQAVAKTDDRATYHHLLDDLIGENTADVIVLSSANGKMPPEADARDPLLDLQEFNARCAATAARAMQGRSAVSTIRCGGKLFDVASIPIRMDDNIVGVMTFGLGNSIAGEFKRLTQSDLVLFSDGHVVGSTLAKASLDDRLTAKMAQLSALPASSGFNATAEINLDDEHFLCRAGSLNAQDRTHPLNYLILSSYERPLQALSSILRRILLISGLGMLLGTIGVWFLVCKVTAPLEELRDSAEAVGRGDFSRRVEVHTRDECGELAQVFNQMTENLKNSREQLEATVETLKTTQAQLIQSEKLSGIGEFVAGVAHELNNPLTAVMGFSELMKMQDADPERSRQLDTIFKCAQRCQKIVQSLLSFARRHRPERKTVCVNTLIEETVEILAYQLRTSNIQVTTQFDTGLPTVMVDPHQIQQVFLNIINNARQAIEANQPKGWIKITTEASRGNVCITIQDSGPGIAPKNLSKIFDPFFTTKEVGKGTGLGLSICYGIIKEHGGTIIPCSRPGEGATFIIELPIAYAPDDKSTTEIKRAAEPERIDPQEGAGKKVLVIDDEEPILNLVRETLTRRGYQVDTAIDGETGLKHLDRENYDVTLCDWKMPGLNGQQVYDRIRKRHPDQSERIIFITGDTVNERTSKFLEEQNRVCLAKPFTFAEFRSAISRVSAGRSR